MSDVVVLEGLHALKHALRFSADVCDILTDDLDKALTTADTVAPELRSVLESRAQVITQAEFRGLTKQPVPTHVVAYAVRPDYQLAQAMPTAERPAVLLDDPRNTKNLGAVVRVGAAAGASGILANGNVDFFDPMAVRGAAGLQWALPCVSSPRLMEDLGESASGDGSSWPISARKNRPHRLGFTLVGLDADGTPFDPGSFPGPVLFAFGSERTGLSDEVRTRCDQIVSLPMTPHVSSLNLATSVSAVLYLRIYALRNA